MLYTDEVLLPYKIVKFRNKPMSKVYAYEQTIPLHAHRVFDLS